MLLNIRIRARIRRSTKAEALTPATHLGGGTATVADGTLNKG